MTRDLSAAISHGDRPRDRMPCLDGLRGLAAVVVMLGHASDFGLPSGVDGHARDCAVLIFFALSGFLMGDLYLSTPSTRSRIATYAAARIGRIAPIYLFVVVCAFLIHSIDPAFVYAVTPLQLVRLLTFNGTTSVLWSIGPEVQFYVAFVGLWWLRGRLGRDIIFAGIVIALACLSLDTIHRWPGVFVLSKLHIFSFGMLAGLIRRRFTTRPPAAAVWIGHAIGFAILAVFLISGASSTILGSTPYDQVGDPAFARFYGSLSRTLLAVILSFVFSFHSRVAVSCLANPVAALLGRCSFSIYLLHVAVFDSLARSGVLAAVPGWVGLMIGTLLTLALGSLTYRVIEAPARRVVRTELPKLIGGGPRWQRKGMSPA